MGFKRKIATVGFECVTTKLTRTLPAVEKEGLVRAALTSYHVTGERDGA